MATHDVHAPPTVNHGEPCANCGAPLAADQRYCLACGARRGPVARPFRTASAPVAGVTTTTVTSTAEPSEAARLRTNLSVLGALACLLLALGIGVLIGRGGADRRPVKPAPAQVITVGAAAAPGAATTTTPDASATTPANPAAPHKSAKHKAATAKSAKGSPATNQATQNLNKLSGNAYQKQAQKLPKVLGTGGKPPPKDNKPAGGGSGFQTIG